MTLTPNLGLTLSDDNSSMSDTDSAFNVNWTLTDEYLVGTFADPLPATNFSYNIGDKIYHATTQSIYVLVAQDAFWGNFWQPVQARYSPWIQPSTSILINTSVYKMGPLPIQYKISNRGKFILRGCVASVDPNGFVDYGTADNPPMFTNLPATVAPKFRVDFGAAVYPVLSAATKLTVAQTVCNPSGSLTSAIWNPSTPSYPATQIFFDGLEWFMGSGGGYGPDA